MTAPGRYCLAVCYCGECPHYKPLVRNDEPTPAAHRKPKVSAWDDREDSTWIDKL